jgi:hypothetical protein
MARPYHHDLPPEVFFGKALGQWWNIGPRFPNLTTQQGSLESIFDGDIYIYNGLYWDT